MREQTHFAVVPSPSLPPPLTVSGMEDTDLWNFITWNEMRGHVTRSCACNIATVCGLPPRPAPALAPPRARLVLVLVLVQVPVAIAAPAPLFMKSLNCASSRIGLLG